MHRLVLVDEEGKAQQSAGLNELENHKRTHTGIVCLLTPANSTKTKGLDCFPAHYLLPQPYWKGHEAAESEV
ncbi:hypothetical protein GLAREA_00351 [Glarea lozoyensis ATCC 20868]|uniref:Uncharacterized protein n=1 Tax=Glarea lozoyensis (strain ATCC 20868 / MF5171) TaxID=1116229 RepID=S3DB43_GLAL2|nr:uncharacterized protein GLAREA_00351 [Glarea lozoyensis ATCC 20868]EPE29191.1 hypothetical protein GLAREA_00351 [Glarea lozoyensis ATCC 20868]